MFGFLIGAASLFGLIKVLRYGGYGRGYGRWGHRGHGHGFGNGGGGRRHWMFRWLFQYLDTTPGQEKVFQAAAEDLEGRARQMREELENLRRDVAKSLKSPQFDAATVRETFARQRAHLDTLEEAVIGHLGKIHEALNPDQREKAATLLENGPRAAMGYGHGGCHGGGWRGGYAARCGGHGGHGDHAGWKTA